MNTIWLKIAGGAVLALALIIGVASFMGGDSSPTPEPEEKEAPKTFQDTVEEDRKNHPVVAPEPIQEEVKAEPENEEEAPPVDTIPVQAIQSEPEPETPKVIYVKPMDEVEEMQAQQLLSWAGTSYSIGRLPGPQYGDAVRKCKDVISRWPESWYAYQAKRILADLADLRRQYRTQYKLDDELLDVSKFYQKRPRTQAMPLTN